MALRKTVLNPPIEGIIRPLNEELEDLGQGVGDERVRNGANISVAKLHRKDLGEVTVGTSETLVRHALGSVPLEVHVCMTSPGSIWLIRSKTDAQKLYLQADASGRTAVVVVSA